MKKSLLLLLLALLPILAVGQRAKNNSNVDKKYLAGAVPVVNGFVQFEKTFYVKDKKRAEIMDSLRSYVQRELVDGEDQLPQSRITEFTPDSGIIAASVEEYMYFKRTAWQIHRVRFFYQLVMKVDDGQFTITMRRIHYKYDPEVTAGDFDDDRRAENWITDEEALTKNGTKLARVSGKFRRGTIDRQYEIFRSAAVCAGATIMRKVLRTVEVEEEVDD